MSKFLLHSVNTGIKFNLLAGNGEVIAVSESYSGRGACLRGVDSIRTCAPMAALEDQTVPGAKAKCPKFELYTDKRGHYRFRLRAANGKIIAASEGYTTKAGCLAGIESVRINASVAEIVEE